jgi:hypothetical protein
LQVLGDVEEIAEGDEDRQEVHDQGGVERANPEQAEVDHRVGQAALAPHPDRTHGQTRSDDHDGNRTDAVLGDLRQTEDDG